MVARYEDDGLSRWVERGIDGEVPFDPNGVNVHRRFFYGRDWQVVETLQDHWKGPRWSWARVHLGKVG